MNGRKFHKYIAIILAICVTALAFTGCKQSSTVSTAYRVVSQIHVQYQNSSLHQRWHFYSDEKMEAVLTYLRLLDPYGTPKEDPEDVAGSDIYIALVYSDGSSKIYHQRDDRYLKIGDGPWKCIDPDTALQLCALLGILTSDPGTTEDIPFDVPPPL